VTVNPARLLQAEAELGQVREGFLADLIAVDADPTRSVSALRGVSFVLAAGSVVRDDRSQGSGP
jgi:imidazolonepropionase-like amidohydrolase